MRSEEYWLFLFIFVFVFFINRILYAVSEHFFSLGRRVESAKPVGSNVFLNVRVKI